MQRQAGIKNGDRLEFSVSSGTITIAPAKPATYKPTKSELAATQQARGEQQQDNKFPGDHEL